MSGIEKTWVIALALLGLAAGGCAGNDQLVGRDGSTAGGPNSDADNGVSFTVSALDAQECLPEPILAPANCKLLTTRSGAGCGCAKPGLTPTTSGVTDAVRNQLQLLGSCGDAPLPPCSDECVCEVSRAIGTSLIECQTLPDPSPDSSGWCYVSADAGEPQADLVADCLGAQKQTARFVGDPTLLAGAESFLACVDGAATARPRGLGEICLSDLESTHSNFGGYSLNEVNIEDHDTVCSTGTCVINRFQGRVGCPYGQAAGAGDCLLPGSQEAVSVAVAPQLVERQAAIASICSCHCAGTGPGPFCTCPESMQCEHLVDDLGLGGEDLAGSYCIPKGSEFISSAPRTECVEPNCGVKHPY